MDAVAYDQADEYVNRLIDLLGKDWCSNQLAEYANFRDQYSPEDLWSHRLPSVSPIVPLLFQFVNKDRIKSQRKPLGYWYGDPLHYIRQLALSIYSFEEYWSKLSNHAGRNNIKFQLTKPDKFNGFSFELLVATDSKFWTYKEYDIEPCFFNPTSTKGSADIILRKGNENLYFQCKTRSPFDVSDFPFELFQYFFGRFYRMVCDYRMSYSLELKIKRKLKLDDVTKLCYSLNMAIKVGINIPLYTEQNVYEFKLKRLDIPVTGIAETQVNKLHETCKGNLLNALAGRNPFGQDKTFFNLIALCSISALNPRSIEDYYIDLVKRAATEANRCSPLIIAIHFYIPSDLESYVYNRRNSIDLRCKIDQILKHYPFVKYVLLSGNQEEYANIGDAIFPKMQVLQVENKYFLNN